MRQLMEITRKEVSRLMFCGGNTKSSLWMQIQADVLGIPVVVPEINDGTAMGTAILASIGSDYYSSIGEAVSEMVRLREPVMPNQSNVKAYKNHYKAWIETRNSLIQS